MPRLISLSVLAILAGGATAHAADLPPNTRLGAIFAQPAEFQRRAEPDEKRIKMPNIVFAPSVDIRPLVNGYYGKPNAFFHKPYYGTKDETIEDRLPYACGAYSYC